MKTIRGIYNNLNESEYDYTYNGVTYYFSSMLYKNKFIECLEDYIENETDKYSTKFKSNIDGDIVFGVILYSKIEKRGFRVVIDGEEYNNLLPIEIKFNIA